MWAKSFTFSFVCREHKVAELARRLQLGRCTTSVSKDVFHGGGRRLAALTFISRDVKNEN